MNNCYRLFCAGSNSNRSISVNAQTSVLEANPRLVGCSSGVDEKKSRHLGALDNNYTINRSFGSVLVAKGLLTVDEALSVTLTAQHWNNAIRLAPCCGTKG